MKKIVILVNTLQSGGAEKQSIFLLNALKNNYPTLIIVWLGNRIEDKIVRQIDGNNFTLICLKGNGLKKIFNLYRIFTINKFTHLFTYLAKPNFLGGLFGRIAGIKKVYTGIRSSRFPYWKLIIERFTTNILSTTAIINNKTGEELLRKKGFKKLTLIENCFPKINEVIARRHKKEIAIISVGRFVEVKDYKTAILSIAVLKESFPHFIFQIVGYGKLETQIKEWITENELNEHIQLFINPDNIPELLNNADIYLSTSLWEGTSNSIMEAMNASLPIVATNVGDNNRLVVHEENGFLHEIGDFKNIAGSLKILAENYEQRNKYGIYSNRILKENYSFEKFKNSYLKLIEQE